MWGQKSPFTITLAVGLCRSLCLLFQSTGCDAMGAKYCMDQLRPSAVEPELVA